MLKKILILTYYFTPCTLTPSQRITFWANNFSRLGFFPTIITREWPRNIETHKDTKKRIGNRIRYEKNDFYEVYYLPFYPGILDKAYLKWGESKFKFLFALVKIIDVLLVTFTLKKTSYSNFYIFIKELLKKKKFDFLIVSGEPFYLFKIGFQLKKKINLDWMADYRDDWTTNELQKQKSFSYVRNFIFFIESKLEKKWLSNVNAVISVSDLYTERLSKFLKVKGLTIENGFEDSLLTMPKKNLFEKFTIVYSGNLYPSQNIKVILGALEIGLKHNDPFNVVFLGSAYDSKEKDRLSDLINPQIRPYVTYTERLKREDALNFLLKAHVLLGIAYGNLKGIPSSKLYEYLALRKPVLLCPTDSDVMEAILKDVELGFFARDAETGYGEIKKIKSLYESGEMTKITDMSVCRIKKYSRFNQLKKLAEKLHDTI